MSRQLRRRYPRSCCPRGGQGELLSTLADGNISRRLRPAIKSVTISHLHSCNYFPQLFRFGVDPGPGERLCLIIGTGHSRPPLRRTTIDPIIERKCQPLSPPTHQVLTLRKSIANLSARIFFRVVLVENFCASPYCDSSASEKVPPLRSNPAGKASSNKIPKNTAASAARVFSLLRASCPRSRQNSLSQIELVSCAVPQSKNHEIGRRPPTPGLSRQPRILASQQAPSAEHCNIHSS